MTTVQKLLKRTGLSAGLETLVEHGGGRSLSARIRVAGVMNAASLSITRTATRKRTWPAA